MKNKSTVKGLFFVAIILVFVLAGCIDGSGGSKSSEAKITVLTLTISGEERVIDFRSGTTAGVELPVDATIPATATVKSVALSPGASGLAQDSTVDIVNNEAKITIIAEDGMTKVSYTVTVTIELLSAYYSLRYPIAQRKADNTITASPVFWKDGAKVSAPSGVSYAVEPMLPSGLELNADTGTITGTMPVTDKATVYTITATGADSITAIFLDKFLVETAYTPDETGTAIGSLDALKTMDTNGEYYLTDHIDLAEETWEPLFTENAPFTGTLRGNGYAVYNLSINGTSSDSDDGNYQGLFAAIGAGAHIENLGIGVTSITGNAAVGALAGQAAGSDTLLDNIAIAAMTTDAKIEATGEIMIMIDIIEFPGGYLGGIVGHMASGELKGYNLGMSVTSSIFNVGGLVGGNEGTVSGLTTGNVDGKQNVGGLVGLNSGTVSGYATGNVSGMRVGGLVGTNFYGTVSGYATGNVKGKNDVGGLVGTNFDGTVSGYWDKQSTTLATSDEGIGISATRNIVFDSTAKTYTDSGTTPATPIFDNTDFTAIFDTANGTSATWPKLKSTYTFNGIDFTFDFPQPTVSDTDSDGVIDVVW